MCVSDFNDIEMVEKHLIKSFTRSFTGINSICATKVHFKCVCLCAYFVQHQYHDTHKCARNKFIQNTALYIAVAVVYLSFIFSFARYVCCVFESKWNVFICNISFKWMKRMNKKSEKRHTHTSHQPN